MTPGSLSAKRSDFVAVLKARFALAAGLAGRREAITLVYRGVELQDLRAQESMLASELETQKAENEARVGPVLRGLSDEAAEAAREAAACQAATDAAAANTAQLKSRVEAEPEDTDDECIGVYLENISGIDLDPNDPTDKKDYVVLSVTSIFNQLWNGIGGPQYVYSVLVGYEAEPAELAAEKPEGKYYNPYFASGHWIGMAPPLSDDQVTFDDGSPSTVDAMSRDVSAFLAWTAEPKMEERKRTGFQVMIFLFVFSVLLYLTKNKIWRNVEH
jgi:cytochrome c1